MDARDIQLGLWQFGTQWGQITLVNQIRDFDRF